MTETNSPRAHSKVARRTVGARLMVGALVAAMIGLILLPAAASANSLSSASQQASTTSVTIPAGGTGTIHARGFCLAFGKPFPTQGMTTNGLASDKVRSALNYSIQKGYTEGNPDQVELAIWFLQDNTWHNDQHTIAQEIVNNATPANLPPSTGDGTAISDAIASKTLTMTANFTAQTSGHYYGDSAIQLTNTGTSDLKLFVPIGTVFTVPGAPGQFQDLAVYALAAPGQATPGATTTAATTPEATTTVTGTEPVAATVTPTELGTSTVAPTVEVSSTVAPTAEVTSTIAPTVEATGTVAPTEQATSTVAPVVQPTDTTAVVETPTTATLPTETPTQPSVVLPQTGGGSGGAGGLLPYLLVAVGFVLFGTFMSLKSRTKAIRRK